MKKRLFALTLALAMAMNLVACGSEKEQTTTQAAVEEKEAVTETENIETEEVDAVQTDSGTYVFTDDIGREVEVPENISRIVPSAPLAQIVLTALAPEMFVGLGAKLTDSSKGILPDYLFELPFFGSLYAGPELNVEELAMTEPQLIIDIGESKPSAKEDLDALQEQTLIPSIYISSSLKDMPETYRKLGKLLGKEKKAEELAVFCEKIYNRTVSIMERVGDNRVNCIYVIGEDGLNVLAKNSYHAELLDMLTNNLAVVDNPISKGTGNEVTMEQISVWNPEFVIFGPGSIYNIVKENETWSKIDAIVNDRYVEVPSVPYNWMNMPPSVQRYLGLIWLTEELYPEYCDYDVKSEIKEYFKLFYDCDLSDEEYNRITANAFLK